MSAPSYTPFGVAAKIGVPASNNVSIKFGDSSNSSIQYDGTNILLNPKNVGSGALVIGSSSSSIDGDLILNKLGIGGSAIGANSYITAGITGSGRTILDFQLIYNGNSSTAANVFSKFTDQGTGTGTFVTNGVLQQTIVDTSTHTGAYTINLLHGQGAFGSNSGFTTAGQVITYAGVRSDLFGLGNLGTHTDGILRTYGMFINSIPNVVGVASQLKMGIWCNGSINIPFGAEIYFDSTSTANGDSYISYINANSDLEVFVDGTRGWSWDNDLNVSEIPLGTKAGTSTSYAKVGGTLFSDTTTVGNVGAGEDDLSTYTLPANALVNSGDRILYQASGSFGASLNNKRLRVRFGTSGTSVTFDTGALAITAATEWVLAGEIIRVGGTSQKGYGALTTTSGTLAAYADLETALNQNLSGTVVVKLTGEATANNDVVQETFTVDYLPNE